MSQGQERGWIRRAQPLLGTLVEVGVPDCPNGIAAVEAAFAAIRQAQSCLSRFEPDSDLSRFHALPRGGVLAVRTITGQVLAAAQQLRSASAGLFDISLGSGPEAWACHGSVLEKFSHEVRLDLGGIGKGFAVDLAVEALRGQGCQAGWVNAGGDLRVFGAVELPVQLRSEETGGVQAFARLSDGAFATSAFGSGHRARLASRSPSPVRAVHVSVAAPTCLWADALTKIVAGSGDASHPLLEPFGARAWLH